MDENGVVEEDDEPWIALVVLAAKTHQENLPWHEYQWSLSVSYQKLNQVTRPFTFHISWWYDTVQDIDTEENYFIVVDMDSSYCQLVAEEEARKILEFFTPDGKRRCKVMSMGDLNAAPTFVAMVIKLQKEWNTLAKERGLKNGA